jgi:hypothetical protein
MSDPIIINVIEQGSSPIVIDGADSPIPTITNGGVIEFEIANPLPSLAAIAEVQIVDPQDGDMLRIENGMLKNKRPVIQGGFY